jgi:hypothetical protein
MKIIRPYIVFILFSIILSSCGVAGDPGYCFFSLDWEYYDDEYGVYYYEDNNPDIPESESIVAGQYYESYPGAYEYYYESEDYTFVYTFTGFYNLVQNPGTPGGFLHDGLDGADTFFDLYLYVLQRKSLPIDGNLKSLPSEKAVNRNLEDAPRSGKPVAGDPVHTETREWEQTQGDWTISFHEEMRVYRK